MSYKQRSFLSSYFHSPSRVVFGPADIDMGFRSDCDRFFHCDVLQVLGAEPASLKKRGMNSMVRPVAAYSLCRYGGLLQRQAAQVMGLRSGVAVSLQIKKLHEQIESTKKLKDILANLKNRLENPKHRNLVLKVTPLCPRYVRYVLICPDTGLIIITWLYNQISYQYQSISISYRILHNTNSLTDSFL